MIKGQLEVDGKTYNICEYNWYGLVRQINDMMRDEEISFPLGEGETMKVVTKKIHDVEKHR